jgi:hypothetical protein
MDLESAKSAVAPGDANLKRNPEQADEEIREGWEQTAYRAVAARSNFLSMDGADIQFAAKEACRRMSAPKRSDWARLKHLARYLIGRPRVVHKYQ